MESIGRFVAGQLAAWEIPGRAIAAVRDHDVILATGHGRHDLAEPSGLSHGDAAFAHVDGGFPRTGV